MKKLLFVCLALLIAVPSFGALKFGVGIGPGILPPSNTAMHTKTEGVDYYNGKMIATKDDNIDHFDTGLPVTDVSYNLIGAPLGLLGNLKFIAMSENFIAYLSGSYLTLLGGNGDIKFTIPAASTKVSMDVENSVSTISFAFSAGPKVQVSELTCVYLQLGLGLVNITSTTKLTVKANDVIDNAQSFNRKFTGSGLFIPMVIGSDVKLMDNMALSLEAIYCSGTALVKYKGKEYLASTVENTLTDSIDLTGLSMIVSVKYFFNL